ncbi:MAG: alpha/beta hydrolase-fold protein [Bacteroidota bacterium]
MKRRFLLFPVICFLYFIGNVQAQNEQNIEHVIQSDVFGKERKVRVFLPERYFRDSTSTFMTTYVLDAQSDQFWNMAKGNIGYMVRSYTVMPMIAVGIVSDNRGEEFSPPPLKLQEHFEKEVFPLIERNYRVNSFRSVVGHSWGGAFISSTLFSDKRDLFNSYIGISPSFGDTDNIIVKNADSLLALNTNFKKHLYLSHGDVGRREAEFGGYVASIDALLKKYPNKSLAFTPRLFEGTDHWQIVIPSINDGLMNMSRTYFADQKVMEDLSKRQEKDLKQQIINFNKKQLEIFGYIHKPSAAYLNFVANDFRDQDQYKSALVLYKMALEKTPNDVKIYVNVADTYDKMGATELAKASFQKTSELLETQKSELSENYYKNVSEWVKEKLESFE